MLNAYGDAQTYVGVLIYQLIAQIQTPAQFCMRLILAMHLFESTLFSFSQTTKKTHTHTLTSDCH